MGKGKKPHPIIENVCITGIAAEGKAIARVNDKIVFVPYVIPGDRVDLQITKKKSAYLEARAIHFRENSPDRIPAVCEHFGICGGCKWQVLPYHMQLQHKQLEVESNLTRIGKVALPPISNIIGSKQTEFYRNKLEFTFSNRRWLTSEEMNESEQPEMNALGFHIPGMFDKVLDIRTCWLQHNLSNLLRNEIRSYALKKRLPFFDLRQQHGLLRTMIVRTTSTGEIMLILVFFEENIAARVDILNHISEKFPEITSLYYVINSKANDTITDRELILYKGKEAIYELMEGLQFKIGPKSFYQTNSDQAYTLYKITREFAQLTGNETVYDLYTGTGTIAIFVAKQAKKVIGIEYVPEAIEDAKHNAQLNKISNALFYAGDMKDMLQPDFIEQHGKPDVIITDPPRTGMHGDVIKAILFAAPKRIVYVSCNSATQARDLNLLDPDYRVVAVQPVDMFPHTHHVENVVLLEKRS